MPTLLTLHLQGPEPIMAAVAADKNKGNQCQGISCAQRVKYNI
jgi:hypothetical protein